MASARSRHEHVAGRADGIFGPLTAAALTLIAGRRPRLQRLITVVALGAVLAVCGVLVYLTDRDGTQALHVGGWGPTGAR